MLGMPRRSKKVYAGVWPVIVLLLGFVGVARTAPFFQTGRRVEVEGFRIPESVATGPDGKYYVSNIGRINRMGDGSIKVISGNPFDGTASVSDVATGLNDPAGIAFVGSDLFVTDEKFVWKIQTSGETAGEKSVFLSPEVFPGGTGLLNDMAADADGHLFMSDTNRGVIFKADPQGNVSVFLDSGPMNPLRMPNGVVLDADGQISGQAGSLLVVDLRNGNLVAVAPDGGSAEVIARGFGTGDGLAFDAQGNLYISDFARGRVHRMKPDRSTEVFARTTSPADLTVDRQRGWLIVPNFLKRKVTFFEMQ
jgi:sugar lactone lactonase YvrE